MVHSCNPGAAEVETGGCLGLDGQLVYLNFKCSERLCFELQGKRRLRKTANVNLCSPYVCIQTHVHTRVCVHTCKSLKGVWFKLQEISCSGWFYYFFFQWLDTVKSEPRFFLTSCSPIHGGKSVSSVWPSHKYKLVGGSKNQIGTPEYPGGNR